MWSKNVLFVTAHNHFEGAVCPTTNHYSLLSPESPPAMEKHGGVTNPIPHLEVTPE